MMRAKMPSRVYTCFWLLAVFLLASLLFRSDVFLDILKNVYDTTLTFSPRNIRHWDPAKGEIYSESVTEHMVQTFEAPLPELLSNYANPCWWEKVPDNYSYNETYYYNHDCQNQGRVRPTFTRLQSQLEEQRLNGSNMRLRCFPRVFLLGVAKSGTTSLFSRMRLFVNGLVSGTSKESQYWVRRRFGIIWALCSGGKYWGAKANFSDFLNFYDSAAQTIQQNVEMVDDKEYHRYITAEFTPANLWFYPEWRSVVGNENLSEPRYILAHHLYHIWPKTKFILIIRNPVTRAKSHYMHLHKRDSKNNFANFTNEMMYEMTLFNECVEEYSNPRRCAYDLSEKCPMIVAGLYYIFLNDWLKVFPREQIFITSTDEFSEDTYGVLNNLVDFLGLKFKPNIQHLNKNAESGHHNTKTASRLSEDSYHKETQLLRDFFAPWNQKLSQLLGDPRWAKWNEETDTV